MNKILVGLRGYLTYQINEESNSKLSPDSREFLENLNLECEQIKSVIKHKLLVLDGDKPNSAMLINYLQRELASFSNAVAMEWSPTSPLSAAADQLIDFLKDEHAIYFNEDLLVPDSYVMAKILQRVPIVMQFNESSNHHKVDKRLAQIIEDFLKQNGYLIKTYAQMNYYLQFADKLGVLLTKVSQQSLQTRLIEQLFYLNFNSLSFISYCGDVYAKHSQEKGSSKTIDSETYECLHKWGQMPQHHRLAFDRSDKSLRTVLKELENFESEHLLELKIDKALSVPAARSKPWITAHMSVPVLMVLAAAAQAADVFTAIQLGDIYAFISENIRTKYYQGPLSKKAMKNRKNEANPRSAYEALELIEKIRLEIIKTYKIKEQKQSTE